MAVTVSGARLVRVVGPVWAGLVALYALRLILFAPVGAGAAVAISAVALTASLLPAALVAWLMGRWPALGRLGPAAVVAHLVFALLFVVVWIVALISAARLIVRAHVFSGMGWELLTGALLYGLVVAGVLVWRSRTALAQERAVALRAEALAADARAAALRAQLNPHFLFNCLHTIGALIPHDPAAAGRAVEQLGDLLRVALGGGAPDVPLAAEWRFTEAYAGLERLRLGDRLRLVMEAEPGALDALVPALILQPLVENAIRHGVAPRPGPGAVTVAARRRGDALELTVRDDGAGAEPAQLERAAGFGLRALRERLGVLGAPAPRIDTAPGAGFAVVVTLPWRATERAAVA